MASSIKAKIALGIGGLFTLLLAISIVAFVFINLLSDNTENLLTANYKTIKYCNLMMHSIDEVHSDPHAVDTFEMNLRLQENNITEAGEGAATQRLRTYFEILKKGDSTTSVIDSINKQLFDISMLNQKALERKNQKALDTSQNAKLWISTLSVLIVLVGFSFAVNFPGYISGPVKILTDGIREIARKNYKARIHIDNQDEFGEMATAFNGMAEKLYEFEHSNISQLMFEKKRVETIINQMDDAVIGFDANRKILFINHNAEEIFNLKAADITGKYAPDVALANNLLYSILQQPASAKPIKIIVDGKENYFSIDHRSVSNDDKIIGEVFTLKNITSFKELDISKTNLLATISHELKTPISSIKMSSKLLNDSRTGLLNAEQKELVNNILDDAERLLRITGELLNMTQIETGNIQLKLQKVDPREIVNTSIQTVQMQADQKSIKLITDIGSSLPMIFADADKSSWVLINLLTNAIRYSVGGSDVLITVTHDQGYIRFSVQDKGIGIEEKYQQRIFDRYFKVPGNTENGTGLGLAISREFIDAQGGQFYLSSKKGEGSTFSFTLPMA